MRAVLQVAQAKQMLNTVLNRLDVPKHHRRRGVQPHPVRNLHDAQPFVAHALERRDALANAVDQNLTATAWNRTESRLLEAANYFFEGHFENVGEMVELGR